MESIELKSKKAPFTSFGVTLLGVLAVALFMLLNFKTVVVSGNSMEPTFNDKERVLVTTAYWLVGDIKKKDIVVVRGPEGVPIIKRVYGVSGDRIDFFNVPEDWSLTAGEYRVPDDTIYILGDNREVSEDSRRLGPIAVSDVLGKVVTPR